MNPEDFLRMIAASERRYAELAALVRQIPHPDAHALMARHAGENGMADWYAKWMTTAPTLWCSWCDKHTDHQTENCPVLEADRQKMRKEASQTPTPDYMADKRLACTEG